MKGIDRPEVNATVSLEKNGDITYLTKAVIKNQETELLDLTYFAEIECDISKMNVPELKMLDQKVNWVTYGINETGKELIDVLEKHYDNLSVLFHSKTVPSIPWSVDILKPRPANCDFFVKSIYKKLIGNNFYSFKTSEIYSQLGREEVVEKLIRIFVHSFDLKKDKRNKVVLKELIDVWIEEFWLDYEKVDDDLFLVLKISEPALSEQVHTLYLGEIPY